MSYNLDAIKRKIADLSGGRNSGQKDRPKLTWFKPRIGEYEIRFLPFESANGQPFQEVSYYDNKLLSENRFVAPAQFGKDDPIFDLLSELRKDQSSETWRLIGALRPKERFYAPILIRGEEEKGVQIWEMNSKVLKDVYSILAHPDNIDENLMDPEVGYDFTLSITDSGKKWNNYVVKSIDLLLRRKSSKIHAVKAEREALVSSVPDLGAYFESLVKSAEELDGLVENFLAAKSGESEKVESSVPEPASKASASRGSSNNDAKVKSIEDAFADLDEESDPF